MNPIQFLTLPTFENLMLNGAENCSQTLDSLDKATEFNAVKLLNMNNKTSELNLSEVTYQPVSEQIKLAIDLILNQVEKLYEFLLGANNLNCVGDCEDFGFGLHEATARSCNNPNETCTYH